MKGQQEGKDIDQLRNQLKYLAVDVGQRERRLTSKKSMYLKESREYNSCNRRVNGGSSFPGTGGSYSSYPSWADWRYRGETKYSTSWAVQPKSRPKSTPWGSGPVVQPQPTPKWKYRVPDSELKKKNNPSVNDWAICWNFNSARGCPRGENCSWKHEKYSAAGNQTVSNEPLKAGPPKRLTTIGRRQMTLKPLHPEAPDSEKKSEDYWNGWPAKAADIAGYTTNAKKRDTDTDSKEVKSSATNFGYNGDDPPGTNREVTGVE